MSAIAENNSRENTIGWIGSTAIHVAILSLMFFTIVWKPQIPAPVEYGIEVNFGTDNTGYGEEQTLSPSGDEPSKNTPQQEEISPVEPQQKADEGSEDLLRSENEESPEVLAPTLKPVEKPAEDPKPTPVTKNPAPQSLFPSEKSSSSTNNNGNKPGTTGDMGKPDGNPDARGIYDGSPGKGKGGTSLDMAGWKWDKKPDINDQSDEEGKIVFQVKVDEDGSLISVTVLEKTVSPTLVRKYQKEVEELSFSKTSGASSGAGATGRITFIITSK